MCYATATASGAKSNSNRSVCSVHIFFFFFFFFFWGGGGGGLSDIGLLSVLIRHAQDSSTVTQFTATDIQLKLCLKYLDDYFFMSRCQIASSIKGN